jgi:hypothetical protein
MVVPRVLPEQPPLGASWGQARKAPRTAARRQARPQRAMPAPAVLPGQPRRQLAARKARELLHPSRRRKQARLQVQVQTAQHLERLRAALPLG